MSRPIPIPTPPLVEVIAQNPGASPEEMERLVGIPIEIALNGMPGLVDLRSTSIAGLTDVKCQFTYDTDYWKARQEVINRINALNNLPPGVNPGLSPWSPTGEIVRYVLEGPGYTLNELKAVQDWVLQRALKTVPGVIDVTGFGGTVKQYQVLVDPDAAQPLRNHAPAGSGRHPEIECQRRRQHPHPGEPVAHRARDRPFGQRNRSPRSDQRRRTAPSTSIKSSMTSAT